MSALSKHELGIGYMMQAREFTSAAEVKASSLAVRKRLFGQVPSSRPPAVREWRFAPAPLPMLPLGDAQQIIREVLLKFNISNRTFISDSRFPEHVSARHEAIIRLYDELGLSASAIGRAVHRDHKTVLYVLGRVARKKAVA